MPALMAIDIGNTSTKIGLFTGSGVRVDRVPTHPARTIEDYRSVMEGLLTRSGIGKPLFPCIICSVVPGHTRVLEAAAAGVFGKGPVRTLVVSHTLDAGITFRIAAPERLGADRIANAAGAYALYGAPVAAVDFGTATTITVVDRDGAYAGGAILPGMGLMADLLAERAARLERVTLENPVSALGVDTEGCIRAGVFFGTAGAVERILGETASELGYGCRVIVTGGNGGLVRAFLKKKHDFHEHLTLAGLKVIYEKNSIA